jgi:hypothetical protein
MSPRSIEGLKITIPIYFIFEGIKKVMVYNLPFYHKKIQNIDGDLQTNHGRFIFAFVVT